MKKLKVLSEELYLKLSPSFMVKAACPFYLKCQYVDKLDDRYIRIPAERGKAIHDSIEELLTYCIEEDMPPADITDGMLREALERHANHGILGEIGHVFTWLRLWAERFKLPAHVVGIEEKVGLDDDYDDVDFEEASYRGIIDLLQIRGNHAVITDWKSQPNILSQSDLDEHEQGTFYCWLVSKLYPEVERFTFRIWYLRYGFYGETFRSEEDLEVFEQALIIKERKIQEISNWDPIPGPQCQYCDFIHRCPIAMDLSPENGEVISQQQAIIAAQKITVMETLTKELKDKLKNYVKKNDDILIGDNWIYGYKHSESQNWKADEVSAVLEEFELDLADYANLDTRKIKKLIKQSERENPELASRLAGLAEVKNTTKFQGYRRKDG